MVFQLLSNVDFFKSLPGGDKQLMKLEWDIKMRIIAYNSTKSKDNYTFFLKVF